MAVDMEPRMLSTLERRARRAKLTERLEIRRCEANGLGIDDLTERVDFCIVMHVVHEVPDPATFFSEIRTSLKPGARLLVIEPKGHVSIEDFERSVAIGHLQEIYGTTLDYDPKQGPAALRAGAALWRAKVASQ